jgi:hypothetical protein
MQTGGSEARNGVEVASTGLACLLVVAITSATMEQWSGPNFPGATSAHPTGDCRESVVGTKEDPSGTSKTGIYGFCQNRRKVVWSKYGNCRRDRKLSHCHDCHVASSPMVHYHFVGIEGAHCGSVGGGGELMRRARILAYITGTVDQELLLRNEYLAAENRILKAQLQGRLRLTDAERVTLGEIGHRLGRKALGEVATAALPDTILGWYRRLVARKFDGSPARRAPGRPPIGKEIEELIVGMAKENRSWGYDRIVGALANLGHEVSDQTVGNVLRRHGIPPAPERRRTTTWAEFVRAHLAGWWELTFSQ